MYKKGTILIFIIISIIISLFCAKTDNKFSFVVVSDVHYEKPDYKVSEYFVKPFANEINKNYPEVKFIAQTGDFIHGGKDKSEDELNFGLKDFVNKIKRPLYISKGNHDQFDKYGEIVKPFFSEQLGQKIIDTYYSFDYLNSHFIFLDCTDKSPEEQFQWLINDLKEKKRNLNIKHIFVFSHYPLWIVARLGFTDKSYSDRLISIFTDFEIDSFFCGHTHNQTVTVRQFNDRKITQLMSCVVVEQGRIKTLVPYIELENEDKTEFIPLEKVRKIFIPEDSLSYYWGYIEGGPSGYFVVNVNDNRVNVKFCSIGKGIIREFYWDKSGELFNVIEPEPVLEDFIMEKEFGQITKADFYYSCWSDSKEQIEAPILLNGKKVGDLKRNFSYSNWWNQYKFEIDSKYFHLIKPENEIIIKNPKRSVFGVAQCLLHISTENKKNYNSNISDYAYLSCNVENTGYFPDSRIFKKVNLGEDLYPIKLRFRLK